jgi:hypothetical protein
MIIVKHVEHGFSGPDEIERLQAHLLETTSRVEGVILKDILFPKDREEFVLIMDCSTEEKYLEWRRICPPPPGAHDWYEVWLSKEDLF